MGRTYLKVDIDDGAAGNRPGAIGVAAFAAGVEDLSTIDTPPSCSVHIG